MISEFLSNAPKPSLFTPCPPASDRSVWEALDTDLQHRLILYGEECLSMEYPLILATDYMDFTRTGNRNRFETKMFQRRTMLNQMVLAECVEHKGRFMDGIINGIYLICEEHGWQLPAHNSYIRDTPQLILPDVTRPVIDLFSAETASVLAMAEYLLRQELAEVSPALSVMVNHALEERIFKPYLKEYFWWMGDGKSHVNNWTVWCTQNVLLSAFTRPLSQTVQEEILQKACKSIDYFLEEYGEDGCCDEGAQYYRHAGLCLFNCLEILNGITSDTFLPAFETEKIKNIASYILTVHVDDIYYVNFADCSPVAGRCNAREFLFGKRTGNISLMEFAASDYLNSEDPLLRSEHNLFYRIQTVFHHGEMTTYEPHPELDHKDFWYESVGIFLARDKHLFLAVKSGNNDDSHNHNDTGSFTIYKDGNPLFIDIGVETYTKKTFSPDRYEIWTMQSRYHNLPTFYVGDKEIIQEAGVEYQAENVSVSLGDELCTISQDIAKAYPDSRIHSYVRTAQLKKGQNITIEDHYEGSVDSVVLSLIFYEEPVIKGHVIQIGNLGTCVVEGAGEMRKEILPITDERLKTAWKHDLYRVLITLEGKDLKLTIQ